MQYACARLSSVALFGCTIFYSTVSHKRFWWGKRIIEYKIYNIKVYVSTITLLLKLIIRLHVSTID